MSGAEVLSLEAVSKRYRTGAQALSDFSIRLDAGSVRALLGPNGAGKSSAIGIMTGLVRPGSGTVRFQGRALPALNSLYRSAIGLVSQHENLDMDLSARENLRLHGLLYGLGGTTLSAAVGLWLDRAGLAGRRDEPVRCFSGGMRRKLQIARAMMHEPAVLILDEPTVGLDPAAREEVWLLVDGLRSSGRAILFSTHYMDEAQDHADRVSIIDRGSLILEGAPAQIIESAGAWCAIGRTGEERRIEFFRERPSPDWNLAGEELTVRRTGLHEVFLSLTGRSP